MDTLNKMKDRVTYLLENYPALRDDDYWLIGKVYKDYYGVTDSDGFLDIMRQHNSRHLPSFETIRRTRQKVQEERPDFQSSKAKRRERERSRTIFFDFAKQKTNTHDVEQLELFKKGN